MPAILRRPLLLALLLGAAAQLLFTWRVTIPGKLFFDEVHYVPAARLLWALDAPVNTEHPLLGKLLIALGMAIAGDGPLGWRILSTFAGSATVMAVFALAWLGLGRVRPAVIAGLLAILNFTIFVQARIAMLDAFMGAFVVGGAACLLWAMRGQGAAAWTRWTLGAVLLGLATATKWAAAPYVAYAALAFLLLARGREERWAGMHRWGAVAVLGVASVGTYFLTFAPAFFYARGALTLGALVPFQWEMLALQTQILAAHGYQSSWWSWPLILRPIWYLYEATDGAQRGVLMIGNPVILWGGLGAVVACAWAALRDRSTPAGVAAATWIGSYAVWAVIPKSLGFFYYYYLPSIWLVLVIAVAFDHWRVRLAQWDEAFVVGAAVLFFHFHPILSAAPLSGPSAFQRWTWLDGWR
ncbi:MAG TPA: glycosyltransferase family 39 protein [Sphingomonas sp.]|jgi:dolichyl-phosphate-mannose--protein O-mannosyl transferase